MGESDVHDPVATGILSECPYENLKARRARFFDLSLPQKLALQGVVLAAIALVLPLAMTMPESARVWFAGADPLSSTPKVLFLGAYAAALEAVAVLALAYVGYRLLDGYDDLSEDEAHHLLTLEEVASIIGLGTGAVAVALLDGFFLLGHAGPDAMAAFLDAGGKNPFAAGTIPLSPPALAVPAGVLAVLVFGLSWVFARRLPT